MSKPSLLRRLNPRLKWRGVRGIRYNQDGISAVEFALIAPILVAIYLGCIELSFLMRVDRRVTSTSSSLGDLTARLAEVDDTELKEMFEAAKVMMQPYDVSSARMRLTSIRSDSAGATTVAWSEAYKMSALPTGSPVTVPAGIVNPGGTVILSEVEYDYKSTFGYLMPNATAIKDRFYLRPRRVNEIPRKPGASDAFGPSS